MLFNPLRKSRRIMAADVTVMCSSGHRCFIWSAIDVDSDAILAICASGGKSILNALRF